MKNWCTYLVECSDGTYYCGITTEIGERIYAHNLGKGAKYTRGRGPVRLVGLTQNQSKSEAAKLEYAVKKQRRSRKIEMFNHKYLYKPSGEMVEIY